MNSQSKGRVTDPVPGPRSQAKAYHKDRVFALVCSGPVDAERARAATRMACLQASEMGYSLLLDLRQVRMEVPREEAGKILGVTENLWRWVHRVALVGQIPETLSWLRYVAGIAQNHQIVAQVFEDLTQAREWAVAASIDPLEGIDRGEFTILLVDDDPEILQISSKALAGAGFQVLQAGSGAECLEVAPRERPDLVLLDVVMPDLEGTEVCRRLKAEPALSGTYVALASGVRTEPDELAEGLSAGADGYIPRPMTRQELVARVEILLKKREIDRRAGL